MGDYGHGRRLGSGNGVVRQLKMGKVNPNLTTSTKFKSKRKRQELTSNGESNVMQEFGSFVDTPFSNRITRTTIAQYNDMGSQPSLTTNVRLTEWQTPFAPLKNG
nr:hypothetical protein Iba_scaffold489CG0170 [Ipomoea batatas]